MPPLPKKKTASARQGKRRQHLKLSVPAMMACSQCKHPKTPHEVCHTCGFYDGREVIAIETKEKKKPESK